MADSKAHIMISVNAILTGALISFSTYQNIMAEGSRLIIPVLVFLISSLVSLIFAVLSARPRVISIQLKELQGESRRQNLTSFAHYTQLELNEYLQEVGNMLQDQDAILDNLKREMYYNGQLLAIKYRFLSVAYQIFTVGFIVSVSLFVWALAFH